MKNLACSGGEKAKDCRISPFGREHELHYIYAGQPPNGSRYLRWGADGEAVQLGK